MGAAMLSLHHPEYCKGTARVFGEIRATTPRGVATTMKAAKLVIGQFRNDNIEMGVVNNIRRLDT